MNKTTLQIKMLYNKMGNAEKRIADWLMENPGKIISLSISELAEQCGCGEATLVRFARRLGFGGYQELKISFAREDGSAKTADGISAEDSCFQIFEKVSEDIYCSLEMTKNSLDAQNLETAAKAIMNGKRIMIYGLGNSAAVALDFQHKLMRLGYNAVSFCDNHMQSISASHLTKKDVVIGISHSGSSKDIVDAVKIAKQNGATTISITNNGKSPIVKQSDIALYTASNETKYSILGLNSRIAQLAIINAIYYYISCQDKNSSKTIKTTEESLQSKKF
ncbi:MAG: MurR/RpiR family transcriptional regulator [Clostridia bacterium]|nr:MurR/RpiR family transcriptional regulator [Clostridia bacterium]MBQ9997852.1 MurR/RpiR family transcriptional regulator [Clostridia bacterium]